MSEQDFLADESRILGAMQERGKKALETGLMCKIPKSGEVQVGYLVYLTHSHEVIEEISVYSRGIAHALNGRTIPYGKDFGNVHTTAGTYDTQIIPANKHAPPQLEILCKLSEAAQETMVDLKNKARFSILHGPVLEYKGLVHDEGTTIAQPEEVGAENYCELTETLAQNTSKRGIQLKKSWGRHISVARVTEDIPPEQLEEFKRFIGQSRPIHSFSDALPFEPVSLNVGSFRLENGEHEGEKRFHLTPFSAFFFD